MKKGGVIILFLVFQMWGFSFFDLLFFNVFSNVSNFFYWVLGFSGWGLNRPKESEIFYLSPLIDWLSEGTFENLFCFVVFLWGILLIMAFFTHLLCKRKGLLFLEVFSKKILLLISFDFLYIISILFFIIWALYIFIFFLFLVMYLLSVGEDGLMCFLFKSLLKFLKREESGEWLNCCFTLASLSVLNCFIFFISVIFFKFCQSKEEVIVKENLDEFKIFNNEESFYCNLNFIKTFISNFIDSLIYKILFLYLSNLGFIIFYTYISNHVYHNRIFLGIALRVIGNEYYATQLESFFYLLIILLSFLIFICYINKTLRDLNKGYLGLPAPIIEGRLNIPLKSVVRFRNIRTNSKAGGFIVFTGDIYKYKELIIIILKQIMNICYGTGESFRFWYVLENYQTKYLSGYGFKFYYESLLLLKCFLIFNNVEDLVSSDSKFFKYEDYYHSYSISNNIEEMSPNQDCVFFNFIKRYKTREGRFYLFKEVVVREIPKDFLFSFKNQCFIVDREGFSNFSEEILENYKDKNLHTKKDILGFPDFECCKCCRIVILPPVILPKYGDFYYIHRYGMGLSPYEIINEEISDIRRLFLGVRDLVNNKSGEDFKKHIYPTSSFKNTKHLVRIESQLILGVGGDLVKIPLSGIRDSGAYLKKSSNVNEGKKSETILLIHDRDTSWMGVDEFEISDFKTCQKEEIVPENSIPILVYLNFRVNFYSYYCPNLCSISIPIIKDEEEVLKDREFFSLFFHKESSEKFFYKPMKSEVGKNLLQNTSEEHRGEDPGKNLEMYKGMKLEKIIFYYYLKQKLGIGEIYKIRNFTNPSKTIIKSNCKRRLKEISFLLKNKSLLNKGLSLSLIKEVKCIKAFLKKSLVTNLISKIEGEKESFLSIYIRERGLNKYCKCFGNITTSKGCLNTNSRYFINVENKTLKELLNFYYIKPLPPVKIISSIEKIKPRKSEKDLKALKTPVKDGIKFQDSHKPECFNFSFLESKKRNNFNKEEEDNYDSELLSEGVLEDLDWVIESSNLEKRGKKSKKGLKKSNQPNSNLVRIKPKKFITLKKNLILKERFLV